MQVFNFEFPKEWEEVRLYVLADLHLGEHGFDEKRFAKWQAEVNADPKALVIVNGDIVNNATRHSVSDVYSETLTPNQQIDKAVELLLPIKEKILVLTEGNHEKRTYKSDGILLMDRVAKELYGADEARNRYTDGAYLIYLAFGKNNGRDSRKTVYSIYGRHGSGGGKKTGAKANRLEDMVNVINADIFLHSHTHTPIGFKLSSFNVNYRDRKISQKEHLFVNTNAFLGFGGYGEESGFRPTSTKYPVIFLNGDHREANVLI